ncbi:MAG: hypothetical protein ACRD0F_06935, partial [Acidimicrobiales bacterium]
HRPGVVPRAPGWPGRRAGDHRPCLRGTRITGAAVTALPSFIPVGPFHPGHLGQRLAKLGIDARAGRRSALMHLASQIPAAVLAEMLNLHVTTAVHWVAAAGGDWSTYAAQVARDR